MDRVILLFLLALFLFASPLTRWWATSSTPWYAPYLIWLALIVLIGALSRRWDRGEL